MGLDETSRAIGKLEASHTAIQQDVTELKERAESMDAKLDRLLARSGRVQLKFKHWLMILAGSSAGGGTVAHILRKIAETLK